MATCSNGDCMILEIYEGEILYLCGLLRKCDGEKMLSERDKQREVTRKALPLGIATSVLGFVVAFQGWLF